jgi:glycosyltransferase involved in cell wall biosynthesis
MASAGIFALPALYEPFGLSPLEAGLAGCALVLGDLPSLREVWDDAACFVPPRDDEALLETLLWLIDRPRVRQEYASRARDRARAVHPAPHGARQRARLPLGHGGSRRRGRPAGRTHGMRVPYTATAPARAVCAS